MTAAGPKSSPVIKVWTCCSHCNWKSRFHPPEPDQHPHPCGCSESVPVVGVQGDLFGGAPEHSHYYTGDRLGWWCRECDASADGCPTPPSERGAVYRVTLLVDQGWHDALVKFTEPVEEGETCAWEHLEQV